MAVTSPVGKIAQVNPGQYVDEANNFWTGTKEAPVYGGPWNGPKPTSFVDVYGASPSAPVPPPATATPPPPPLTPPPAPAVGPSQTPVGGTRTLSDATPDPVQLPGATPGQVTTQPVPGNPRSGDPNEVAALPGPLGTAAPTGAYLQKLLAGGMSPQEAVALFNQQTGRTTGNEAVYYGPEVHGKPTIGLPGEYLSQEGNGWQVTQRLAETGGTGPKVQASDYDFNQARANVEKAIGRPLSDADVAEAFAKFGGSTRDRFTDAGLAPVIAYFKSKGTVAPPSTPPPTAGPGGPLATGTTGPSSNVNSPYGDQGIMDQFRAAIAKRLQEIGSPVDENSSNIAAPLTAARNEASRVSDQERNALAERLYAQQGGGLNTDALTRGIQQSAERNAVGLGGLRAQLITREYDARRQDLTSMLAQATASGDNASARAIQQQLAALDATLKREGMGIDLAKYLSWLNLQTAQAGANG